MRGNWKRNLILLAVFAAGVMQVTDVYAIWPFRRRANSGYSQSSRMNYATRTYGTRAYATAPAGAAMPSATVTAPGVGVNTGPGGVNVAAPGVGVNAGAGANVGVGAPGAGIRVRGQTPEGAPPR